MTPGIEQLKKANVPFTIHEFTHNTATASFGIEAAEKLNVPTHCVFKTLVIELNTQQLAVAIIPVMESLNLKLAARALGAKNAAMADKQKVERTTGYVLGGVSPFGQKKQLKTVICDSARSLSTLYVSAGRRGLEIQLNFQDLQRLTKGKVTSICR